LVGYFEKHHIIPKCMGGSDSPDNIVALTAREHFVAHQLLVKINPQISDLVFAFRMLSTANHGRVSSRVQGWLRAKMAQTACENMRARHAAHPEILERAAIAGSTPEAVAKRLASFANTMSDPAVREKWSNAAKARWDKRDKAAHAKSFSERMMGCENGRSKPVVQLLPNGFIVNEFPNMKAAAVANGHDKHTIYDRVKRGHPLWIGL